MPVSKSLKKLQKNKSDTALHARSLKYKQFTTAEHRQMKIDKRKAQRQDILESRLERFKFIQQLCKNLGQETYSLPQIRTMIQSYIDRNLPERQKLEKDRRPGRPPSSRLLNVKNLVDRETQEFQSGFNIMDLSDPQTVKNLLEWEGSYGGINTLKMTQITKK